MRRTTRFLSVAAAVITVGALALPVSAAIADTGTSSPDDTTAVPPSNDPTTAAPSTEGQSSTSGAQDDDTTGSADVDSEDSTAPTTTEPSPTEAVPHAATPSHVKARLVDADSAVVTWREADTTGASFTVTLVRVGGAAATALPAVPATATARSAEFDGLTAGARYRATVTVTTADGSMTSAPSNVIVAPKAKHVRSATPKPAHVTKAKKTAKVTKPTAHGTAHTKRTAHGG